MPNQQSTMSNSQYVSVNLQCPKDLWQAIQSKANSLGKDPVTVTIDTLNQAFGLNLEPAKNLAINEEISQLKNRLNIIEQVIKPLLINPHLSQVIVELRDEKPNNITQELQLERGFKSSISSVNVYPTSLHSLTNDDIEDEPDEILYDFLQE